jgi:hypothetical protein
MRRVIAALNEPRRIPEYIVYARAIANALANEPRIASPTPSLAVFEADVTALEAAEARALLRGTGRVATRNACWAKVRWELKSLRSYVQSVADSSPDDAAAVILRCGMSVKNVAGPAKEPWVVKPGPVPGSVHLYARAAKGRASYEWQYSLDGKLWTSLPPTTRADAKLQGLVVGRRHFFRYRYTSKGILSDWSDVVSLIVG